MKVQTFITALFIASFAFFSFHFPDVGAQEFKVPDYVTEGEDLEKKLQDKGKDGTNILFLIATMFCIAGAVWGVIDLNSGNGEKAKAKFWGAGIGLLILVSIYAIVKFIVK